LPLRAFDYLTAIRAAGLKLELIVSISFGIIRDYYKYAQKRDVRVLQNVP